MADLTTLVDTDGVTGDYSSMNLAVVGEAQDLTDGGGDTWTCTCQASTGVADTTSCDINGWTTASSNWMKIIAESGNKAIKTGIDTSRYRFNPGAGLNIHEDYVTIEDLQIIMTTITSFVPIIQIVSVNSSNAILLKNLYIEGGADTGGANEQGITSIDDNTVLTIENCILYNISQRCIDLDNGTMIIYNCSMRGSNIRAGIDSEVGTTITIKNTSIFYTTDDFDIAGTSTLDYNASDDGDGSNPQTPSGADWDNEFNDPSNGDFTALTGGNIENNGVGPSVDVNVPTSDIDGTPRFGATCDIGADEIAAISGETNAAFLGSNF
jgi:hypothetical protein